MRPEEETVGPHWATNLSEAVEEGEVAAKTPALRRSRARPEEAGRLAGAHNLAVAVAVAAGAPMTGT